MRLFTFSISYLSLVFLAAVMIYQDWRLSLLSAVVLPVVLVLLIVAVFGWAVCELLGRDHVQLHLETWTVR